MKASSSDRHIIFIVWQSLIFSIIFNKIVLAQNCYDVNKQPGFCTNTMGCGQLVDQYAQYKPTGISFSDFISRSLCGYDGYDFLVCCPVKVTPIQVQPVVPPNSNAQTIFQFVSLTYGTSTPGQPPVNPSPPITNGRYALPRNPTDKCGISNASQTRVIGGSEARRGAYPWVVALGYQNQNTNNPSFYCAGNLITTRHVLTTAHCLTPELYMVRLGTTDISTYQPGALDARIEKRITHPGYDPAAITNDVAILKLINDVPLSDVIRPICLPLTEPLMSRNLTGYNPFVAGWGAVRFQGPSSNVLRDIQLPIIDLKTCEQSYRVRFPTVTLDNRVLCAGFMQGGRDTCQGDSGGPLMLPQMSADRNYYFFYLIGIVSYGYECALAGFPGIYTRVAAFVPWIESQLNE